MKILVNGQEQEITPPVSISEYLMRKGYERTLVSVELNFHIIFREHWEKTLLQEGDNMEIIRFVGGG